MQKYHEHLASTKQSLQLHNNILPNWVHTIFWFFSTNLSNIPFFFKNLQGKKSFGHKCIIKHFNHMIFTTCIYQWFFTIKRPRSSRISFCYTSSFLKQYFTITKLEIELPCTCDIWPFFVDCFSTYPHKWLFTSFSNLFAIAKWSISTFFQ